MPDQGVPLHRVRGLVSGANWRATKFATAVPPHLTCSLCRVISPTTFLLPCFHTLCESCVSQSANDENAVCPFDEQAFTVRDCPKFPLPPDTPEKLKACCWNESQGCTYVGTLQAVLTHYEQECTLHAMSCPRCRGPVLLRDLPRHYRAGCQGDAIANATEQPTVHQGLMLSAQDIAANLDELKALIRDPYHDRLLALQSKLNEVLEGARNIGTQVEAVTSAFADSEQRFTQALGEHSRTFGLKLQSLEAQLRDNRSDTIARALSETDRRLSEQLTQSGRELSAIFGQELRTQIHELSAHLTKVFEDWMTNAREAETTGAGEMPWKLEKKQILRKLELVATESHAYLEMLRQKADEQLKQLVVEYKPFFSDYRSIINIEMSPFMGKPESEEKGYVVSLTNTDYLIKSKKVIGLFTQWYRRDKYLQVAADGITSPYLYVYLKWGGTQQGSCSGSHEADVSLRHPDYPDKEDIALIKSDRIPARAAVLGFQDVFFVLSSHPYLSGSDKGGGMTLVVSFKNSTTGA